METWELVQGLGALLKATTNDPRKSTGLFAKVDKVSTSPYCCALLPCRDSHTLTNNDCSAPDIMRRPSHMGLRCFAQPFPSPSAEDCSFYLHPTECWIRSNELLFLKVTEEATTYVPGTTWSVGCFVSTNFCGE